MLRGHRPKLTSGVIRKSWQLDRDCALSLILPANLNALFWCSSRIEKVYHNTLVRREAMEGSRRLPNNLPLPASIVVESTEEAWVSLAVERK